MFTCKAKCKAIDIEMIFILKFKFIYSHLFNDNTTTIRKKRREKKKER